MRRASVRVGNSFLAVLAVCGILVVYLGVASARPQLGGDEAGSVSDPLSGQVVSQVRIGGTLLSGDTPDKLLRFLDMRLPSRFDDELRTRVRRDLDVLGYSPKYELAADATLTITVLPMRVVRRLYVTGNWPIWPMPGCWILARRPHSSM